MDLFVFVPGILLGCYVILMCCLLGIKSSKLKKVFTWTLIAHFLWAVGSLFMRLGIAPSYEFWFYVSIFGLIMTANSEIHFIEKYLGSESYVVPVFMSLEVIVFFVNMVADNKIMVAPRIIYEGSAAKFVYDNVPNEAAVMYSLCAINVAYLFYIVIRGVKNNKLTKREGFLILIGKFLVFFGNVMLLIDKLAGIPFDLIMGIIDAICLYIVVGINKRVRGNYAIQKSKIRVVSFFALFTTAILLEKPIEALMTVYAGSWGKTHFTIIVQAVSVIFVAVGYALVDFIRGTVFEKENEDSKEKEIYFRTKSHNVLEEKELQELITETVTEWVHPRWISLIAYRFKYQEYRMTVPFENGNHLNGITDDAIEFVRKMSHEAGKRGKDKYHVIDLSGLQNKDEERTFPPRIRYMMDNGVQYIQPIYNDNKLYALILIGKENKLTFDEKRSLGLLSDICIDAVRNAELYNRVYWQSRTDEMTGLGNRIALMERMKEIREKDEISTVAMAMVKVDNFRVINLLYGIGEGDRLLHEISDILVQKSGKTARVFRFAATEFVILLDRKNISDVRQIAEECRLEVMNLSEKNGKRVMVTLSAGICEIDDSRKTDDKMLDNAGLALFTARKRGKNCVIEYTEKADSANMDTVSAFNTNLFSEYEAVFRALTAAIDAKDHYTFAHSQNVAYYAGELAKSINANEELVETVQEAGLLHDIGKIGIPETVLKKPDRLSAEEYQIMKSHVEQSSTILNHLSGMEYILPAVMGHHERYDGKGYPRGLAGEDIPIGARILSIVDSFDAMTSRRPYKKQFPVNFAISQLIDGKGKQFDPELVDKFVELIENGMIQLRNESQSMENIKYS